MTKHKWEVIEVQGPDLGHFWHCYNCGSCGGPTEWGDGKPGSYLGFFLAGTSLSGLSNDCDEARASIDAYVAKYPDYKDRALAERTRTPAADTAHKEVMIMAEEKCPLCGEMMLWSEAAQPMPGDWCQDCRDTVINLVDEGHDDGALFRKAFMEHAAILVGLVRAVMVTNGK